MTELMQIRMYLEGTPYTIEVGDTSNLDTKLMLLQKHWAEIIQEAGDFLRSGTTNTATIYLYSKGGITVSPYEPGYTIPTLPPASVSPSFAPGEQLSANPNEQPNEPTPEPNTPAPSTPGPSTPQPNTPQPNTPEPNTPEPNTPEPVTPEPVTPEPNTPEPVTPEPVTPEPVTPEPNTPEPSDDGNE